MGEEPSLAAGTNTLAAHPFPNSMFVVELTAGMVGYFGGSRALDEVSSR